MKNASRFPLLLLACLFGFQALAQNIGIRAGLNLATALEKDEDETYSDNYNLNPGFHAGVTMNVPLQDALSLETGLFVTKKGVKYEDNFFGANVKATVNLYYLDIPVTLKATTSLGESGARFFGAFGPYFDFGISGTAKVTAEYQGMKETEKEDIKWGNDENNDDIKRTDVGLTIGAGLEIESVQVGIAYALGLSNNSPYTDFGTVSKNRVLQLFVGYWFPVSN
ncbi:MAG: PorT family protein [Phaeodactylibacter sp.]|nr:PorT family protein [Phaeodactylibacter sp.]